MYINIVDFSSAYCGTNQYGHIGLLTYPSFSKYSLRRLYHIRPDCFNSYKDHSNLIEHILRGFVLFASSNLNPSGIFM